MKIKKKIKKYYWSLRRTLFDGWYYIKCLIWYRYNVVKAKTLPPTWVDRDELLLHICFQVFCDWVEKEDGLNHWAFDYSSEIEEAKQSGEDDSVKYWTEKHEELTKDKETMTEMYSWWKNVYPFRDEVETFEQFRDDAGVYERYYKSDTEMLHKLIQLRHYYWT